MVVMRHPGGEIEMGQSMWMRMMKLVAGMEMSMDIMGLAALETELGKELWN